MTGFEREGKQRGAPSAVETLFALEPQQSPSHAEGLLDSSRQATTHLFTPHTTHNTQSSLASTRYNTPRKPRYHHPTESHFTPPTPPRPDSFRTLFPPRPSDFQIHNGVPNQQNTPEGAGLAHRWQLGRSEIRRNQCRQVRGRNRPGHCAVSVSTRFLWWRGRGEQKRSPLKRFLVNC